MKTAKQRKRESKREEERIIHRLGGHLTGMSGADLVKGDGRVFGEYRVENKITDTDSYRLEGGEWKTILRAGRMAGEVPLFVARLPWASGHLRLVAMPLYLAEEILGEVREFEGKVAKGFALSVRRWEKLSSAGYLRLRLRDYQRVDHDIVVMEWEDFCRRKGY